MSLPIVNANSNLIVSPNVEVHCNSSGGSFNVTLPIGSSNDVLKFIDIGRNWNQFPVSVLTNGTDVFYDGTTSYTMTYPGIYEFNYIGNNQWIYFSSPMQDPNIVNNLNLNGLTGNINNNTMNLSFSSVTNSNTLLAGPTTGSADLASFRSLVSKDLCSNTVTNGLYYNDNGNISQSSDLTFNGVSLSMPVLNTSSSGSVNLANGFATVHTNKVSANCLIFLTVQAINSGAVGYQRITSKVNGTSFNIQSTSPTDSSTVGWLLINS